MFRRFTFRYSFISSFIRNETGATAIEYGMIAALMFLAIVTACSAFGDSATAMYQKISEALDEVM